MAGHAGSPAQDRTPWANVPVERLRDARTTVYDSYGIADGTPMTLGQLRDAVAALLGSGHAEDTNSGVSRLAVYSNLPPFTPAEVLALRGHASGDSPG